MYRLQQRKADKNKLQIYFCIREKKSRKIFDFFCFWWWSRGVVACGTFLGIEQ